jgi:ubiquinone/menaquinone biosynthesis C-methylase UbiE
VARTSEKHHWERFWEESEQIDDVYDTDGRVVRALVEVLDPQGARILEVGAGSGRDSLELQRHGAMVAVVDYTPSALHLIRRQQAGDQLLPICGNAFQLPFADGVFDAVFHQGLLEHFRNPLDMVRENARVLKPGGVLLVDVPQRYHYYTPLKHILIGLNRWFAGWETEFSIGELRSMLHAAQLQPVHEYGDWCVPNLFYRVARKHLLHSGVRLPQQPHVPVFGPLAAQLRARFSKTALPLYTGMNIGCIGRKVAHTP